MDRLHLPKNLKVHFAGLEKPNYAIVAANMGVRYGLYTAFPFVAEKLFGKKQWPIIPFKWMTNTNKQVPMYINANMRHTIQDSGLYSLLFGVHRDKATKEFVYKWYDALVEFTLEHGQDVTVVEVDAQAIIGVEETWSLRERMRRDLPKNRIINVFHIEDGQYGLDRLIEYSDYLAIGSGVTNNGFFAYPLCKYIKSKKNDIDIHLLGCTKKDVLAQCSRVCTSSDSVSWMSPMQFGEFDNGERIDNLDSKKVRNMIGDKTYVSIRNMNGEKVTNASIVSAELCKINYSKWCGWQDYDKYGKEIIPIPQKNGVILLSGGMDSVTLLHEKKDEISLAIGFDYGGNHNMVELEYAKRHCDLLGVKLIVIPMPFMSQYFSGSLLNGSDSVQDGDSVESKKSSVIPFRNGIMLSIACGIAESNGLNKVFVANHKGNETVLPDCSQEFIDGMNRAMVYGTYTNVTIVAPYTSLYKSDILSLGNKLGIDYASTYSCYKGGETHCGVCAACVERKKALLDANIKDNTIYKQ